MRPVAPVTSQTLACRVALDNYCIDISLYVKFTLQNVLLTASLAFLSTGRRGTEISPRVLHLSELQDIYRGWRHIRSGGEIQTLLVSLKDIIIRQASA